ncbi:MAG: enolase C-terminal domain-like protein [Burkholderiaceae bacterium]
MSRITRVEVHEFDYEATNLARDGIAQTITFARGSSIRVAKFAVVIHTAGGGRGEYVAQWVATKSTLGQALMLCPRIVGKDARERIAIYEDLKRDIRQFDHMGHGPIDIALWDWAGRHYGASIAELLGGYRKRLPAYASTYHADRAGGLHNKEAFVEFARHCRALGYRAFKVHGWNDGNAREEAENVLHLAKHVGHEMTLMLDPACELRTFADALYVGRACDDAGYFWYEDPYRDGGTSAFAHKKLREMIRTPLLMTEHVRGVEPKADFVLAGGTDLVRVDPEYDMGITGSLKIANMAESLGLDCEIHASGPAHRHLMAALRNTNFYEVALVGPDCPNALPPVYACGYTDQLECVDADGTVGVPEGPGLGVTYDWDFITRHRTALHVFE